MIFKIIGGLLVAWGVLDIAMSWGGTDIWFEWLGIDLWSINQLLGKYIAWVEILAGSLIWGLGNKAVPEEHDDTPA